MPRTKKSKSATRAPTAAPPTGSREEAPRAPSAPSTPHAPLEEGIELWTRFARETGETVTEFLRRFGEEQQKNYESWVASLNDATRTTSRDRETQEVQSRLEEWNRRAEEIWQRVGGAGGATGADGADGADGAEGAAGGGSVHVEMERTLGKERPSVEESNPYGEQISPEDVNPNVRRIPKKLLQPAEMRISGDEKASDEDPRAADRERERQAQEDQRQKLVEKSRRLKRANRPGGPSNSE